MDRGSSLQPLWVPPGASSSTGCTHTHFSPSSFFSHTLAFRKWCNKLSTTWKEPRSLPPPLRPALPTCVRCSTPLQASLLHPHCPRLPRLPCLFLQDSYTSLTRLGSKCWQNRPPKCCLEQGQSHFNYSIPDHCTAHPQDKLPPRLFVIRDLSYLPPASAAPPPIYLYPSSPEEPVFPNVLLHHQPPDLCLWDAVRL